MQKKTKPAGKSDKPAARLLNEQQQGVDKVPGQEKGKKEKVTTNDLKGKKVDADPDRESDKPVK